MFQPKVLSKAFLVFCAFLCVQELSLNKANANSTTPIYSEVPSEGEIECFLFENAQVICGSADGGLFYEVFSGWDGLFPIEQNWGRMYYSDGRPYLYCPPFGAECVDFPPSDPDVEVRLYSDNRSIEEFGSNEYQQVIDTYDFSEVQSITHFYPQEDKALFCIDQTGPSEVYCIQISITTGLILESFVYMDEEFNWR